MKKSKKHFTFPFFRIIGLLLSITLLQSCFDDESDLEKQRKADDQLVADHLTNNNITAERTNSGFYFIKTRANDSGKEVENSDIVSFYYKMSLLDGKKIGEVNEITGKPVKFLYRTDQLKLAPTAINIAAGLMREGEVFRLFVPAYLGFESYAYKSLLPAHAGLVIDVEIVKIDTKSSQQADEKEAIENYIAEKEMEGVESFATGLRYKKLSEGSGDKPKSGNQVTVSYKGTYLDGTVFDESESNKPLIFRIGNKETIAGFESGIRLMQKGEEAILIIPSDRAYGSSVEVIPNELREDYLIRRQIQGRIPPYSTLVFQLTLEDIK
ncbi:hypothetical protein FNH22_00555 [Fulvivirga sp. M361]|uniref:FKBP-type peptidyl-prolyl cis-trans isomerase n=1 Tax=Fulvivirga sp. M361 TaxID=2594266 RepID=UPI00117BCB99|nr:FKBP-type peptidyl-prolyl cis-trans isomerase [Fulvivirga sp. M361]TRX62618.1 hypothetical protein FNH22_00555 [Fulvivirga sp. M361]